MTTYPNGRVPLAARDTIDDEGRTLLSVSARAWDEVVSRVEDRYGWTPEPTSPGPSAYRTVDEQIALFLDRYTTNYGASAKFDRRVWNGVAYWRRPGKSAAAVPGKSNHGYAKAVDVQGLGKTTSSTRYRQFKAVAEPLGFSNVEGLDVGELWHWVHDGKTAPPPPPPTFPAPTERPAMSRAYRRTSKPFRLVTPGHWYQLPLNDAGSTNALAGVDRCDFDAELMLTVEGLPTTDALKVRFVQMPDGSEKSDVRYGVVELPGTAGATYGRTGAKGSLPKGKRLRVLVMTEAKGVVVKSVQSRVDYWKP